MIMTRPRSNETKESNAVEHTGLGAAAGGRNVLLGPGRYRVRATIRLADFRPMMKEGDNDDPGGLTLNVSGFGRTEPIRKDTKRQQIQVEFEVLEDQRQIDLSIELRARSGRAWIARDSLELKRLVRQGGLSPESL